MKTKLLLPAVVLITSIAPISFAQDAERTAAFTEAEREEVYSKSIGRRADAILVTLNLSDTNKVDRVRTAIMTQYRSLRARDAALDAMFTDLTKNAPGVESNRPAISKILSRQLHEQFLSKLSADLTPAQVEQVKDKMTYNKVQVTYDAYCEIVPGLKDSEKASILEALKFAREEAMEGGSADEKSAIFQQHKDTINAMLKSRGHDVEKATREWETKQAAQAAKDTGSGK